MIKPLGLALYGENEDLTGSPWWTVLAILSVLIVVFGLVLVPPVLGRSRKNRHAQNLLPLAFFWGLFAAWSGISFTLDQVKWSKERASSIASGYYDPRSNRGAPQKPWKTWLVLGVTYAAVAGYALVPGNRRGALAEAPRDSDPPGSGPPVSGGVSTRT
jgi:hypothetical protein